MIANSVHSIQKIGNTRVLPTLPDGVTAYIPQSIQFGRSNTGTVICGKLVDFGSLNVGTDTFTDGVAMPTITELNVSRATHSLVFIEVTTVLSGAAGSITITYVDQDGNTAETNTARALTTSSAVGSCGIMDLNVADVGARDITAAARTSGTMTGVVNFWGLVPICAFTSAGNLMLAAKSLLANNLNITRLGAGDRIAFFEFGNTATFGSMGMISYIGE
jgi:hypothetical protein